jgi:DNA-binding NtrC family response regulator
MPDIVIQDYFMEDMNGLDVLRKVKKSSPKTEFIFLTGNESVDVAINSIKYGAFDYIIKDEVAMDKVNDKIIKITRLKALEHKSIQIKKYILISTMVVLLIIVLSILFFVILDK